MVGYYVQDEPAITAQPETFHQYSVIKAADPSGFNLAVLDRPLDVPFWKDAVDVVGVDPYPVGDFVAIDTRAIVQVMEFRQWPRQARRVRLAAGTMDLITCDRALICQRGVLSSC